jgi:hypothetical protein
MFNKPLREIKPEDVLAFCRRKNPITPQLDYVADLEQPDLPQRIAALANMFGGLMFIGVTPDKNGKPVGHGGVPAGDYITDEVRRLIAMVNPCPQYELHINDKRAGRSFVLLRIFEGTRPPYFASEAPHVVWVRTKQKLEPADRPTIERLHERRDEAEIERQKSRDATADYYQVLLGEGKNERAEQRSPDDGMSVYIPELDENTVTLKLHLQPDHPRPGVLGQSPELLAVEVPAAALDYGESIHTPHFPADNLDAAPGGVAAFNWRDGDMSRDFRADQIYTNGVIFHAHQALTHNAHDDDVLHLGSALIELHDFLAVATKLYSRFSYSGALTLFISLDDALDKLVSPAVPHGAQEFVSGRRRMTRDAYTWEVPLDTHQLQKPHRVIEIINALARRMHWDLRVGMRYEDSVLAILAQTSRISSTTLPQLAAYDQVRMPQLTA